MTVDAIAHVTKDGREHGLREHLEGVAQMAREFASSFGAAELACNAGRWHDIGKYSKAFQERITKAKDPETHIENKSNRPDHSSAGAQHANKAIPHAGRLIAYTIAGHHAGLSDGRSNETSCLEDRLKKNVPDILDCPEEILTPLPPKRPSLKPVPGRAGFQTAFLVRMLYSCLTDADFLDTEGFMDENRAIWRGGYPSLAQIQTALTLHLSQFTDLGTEVNRCRADVLKACGAASEKPPGIFSLTVPTGGGKTLSSLDFAVRHAIRNNLHRVIYVIPYTSIIEQTASVFRSVFENGGLDPNAVLEHHSNFDPGEEDHRSRLASENWDAPLIVTTNVQFFESLFHNRSSRCRRLHNIAKSVVILDEAQMIPVPMLRPCMEAIRELTMNYGSTVVLCTATQPALEYRSDFTFGFEKVQKIIDEPERLYRVLKRVSVENLGVCADGDIAELIRSEDQSLCVVNTRIHARKLYEILGKSEEHFHLSADMCPEHRKEKLKQIRQRLKDKQKCRVVSTQLVEAGVDVDFPVVFRASAGIDSIAQAAGRCNREGRLESGKVFIFKPESGIPAGDFRLNAEAAETVLRHHSDPLSLESVQAYFETLYWRKGSEALDEEGILKLFEEDNRHLNYPFKTVAKLFQIIKEEKQPVIIPWNEKALELIGILRYADHAGGFIRRLQSYTVGVFPKVFAGLYDAKCLEPIQKHPQCYVLTHPSLYRDDLGLCPDDPFHYETQDLMV
jgi:CRISPR-associated endonuclease/helicase Cas3